MLRIRLASLAFALGLLFTLSGCCSMSDSGPMFPRVSNLFHRTSLRADADCECHGANLPPGFDGAQGPMLTPSHTGPMPIPITNIPANKPPQLFKAPAAPTPYVPTN